MGTGADNGPKSCDAARWEEGCRRHETIRRLIDRHTQILPQSEVTDAAWELGVNRATLYRLIELYRKYVMQISEITKVVSPDTFERPIHAGDAI
jgi:hypothetical protein